MKKLSLNILLLIIPILLIMIGGSFLPPNKALKNSLFFAHLDKNKLLITTQSPRIVFIGGSNLSFSLDCQKIKDSIHMNPVNTGIDGSFGLKFILRNSLHYIKANDVVIVSPEYHQFCDDAANGNIELLSLIIDISPQIKDLDFKQYLNLIQYVPKYASSKIKLTIADYFKSIDTSKIGIYDRRSFNSFGDAYIHWTLNQVPFIPSTSIGGNLNEEIFGFLVKYQEELKNMGAKLYITFPAIQDISYNHDIPKIKKIEAILKEKGFNLLGTPERYIITDSSMIFNTEYHLTKKGVDYRTQLLIEDLKQELECHK